MTTITHTTHTDTNLGETHRWAITDNGTTIAYLDAHTSGLILNVEVTPERRGEGLARALYEAGDAEIGLLHIPAWGCTEEGLLFAEAMGGYTMDDEEAGEILGLTYDEDLGTWVA